MEKAKSRPESSQTASVTTAMPITAGTNTADTLSAIRAMGALVAAASDTMRMIWERVVSSPTRVARHRRYPEVLMVAAETVSPGPLSTGTDSPVRAASLTALSPSKITPSTGMASPGRTAKVSPTATSPMGTVTSCPSRTKTAVWGARPMRPFRASVVRPLLMASSSLPRVISVGIMAAVSK